CRLPARSVPGRWAGGVTRSPSDQFFITLPARLAAAAGAATIAAVAAAAAEATFRFRPRLVHGQRTPAHLVLVQLARGLLSFLVGRHFDERETAGPARRGVAHHTHRFDSPGAAEQLLQLRLTGRVRKIPDVQPSTHCSLLVRTRPLPRARCRSPN